VRRWIAAGRAFAKSNVCGHHVAATRAFPLLRLTFLFVLCHCFLRTYCPKLYTIIQVNGANEYFILLLLSTTRPQQTSPFVRSHSTPDSKLSMNKCVLSAIVNHRTRSAYTFSLSHRSTFVIFKEQFLSAGTRGFVSPAQ